MLNNDNCFFETAGLKNDLSVEKLKKQLKYLHESDKNFTFDFFERLQSYFNFFMSHLKCNEKSKYFLNLNFPLNWAPFKSWIRSCFSLQKISCSSQEKVKNKNSKSNDINQKIFSYFFFLLIPFRVSRIEKGSFFLMTSFFYYYAQSYIYIEQTHKKKGKEEFSASMIREMEYIVENCRLTTREFHCSSFRWVIRRFHTTIFMHPLPQIKIQEKHLRRRKKIK